jgi:hypothetical protein
VNLIGDRVWLAADHVRSAVDEHVEMFDDFEADDGFGSRWSSATIESPTELADVARDCGVEFLISARAATSYGLPGLHKLSSKPFVIDHDSLSFLMFDFGTSNTGVELIVAGKPARQVNGHTTRRIQPVHWDLRDLRGSEARLELTDQAPGAENWIGIDEVLFSDP